MALITNAGVITTDHSCQDMLQMDIPIRQDERMLSGFVTCCARDIAGISHLDALVVLAGGNHTMWRGLAVYALL